MGLFSTLIRGLRSRPKPAETGQKSAWAPRSPISTPLQAPDYTSPPAATETREDANYAPSALLGSPLLDATFMAAAFVSSDSDGGSVDPTPSCESSSSSFDGGGGSFGGGGADGSW